MSNQALKTKQNSKRGRGTLAKHVTSACQSQKIFAQGHLKKNDTLSRRAISERATINAKEVNDCWQTFFFAFLHPFPPPTLLTGMFQIGGAIKSTLFLYLHQKPLSPTPFSLFHDKEPRVLII